MKTQGEIESAISEGMGRFQEQYMGRGPREVRVHLLGDLVVVRSRGVLTAAEQHLVKTLPCEKGRDLLIAVFLSLSQAFVPPHKEKSRRNRTPAVFDCVGLLPNESPGSTAGRPFI